MKNYQGKKDFVLFSFADGDGEQLLSKKEQEKFNRKFDKKDLQDAIKIYTRLSKLQNFGKKNAFLCLLNYHCFFNSKHTKFYIQSM
jgi:hypothetical protein